MPSTFKTTRRSHHHGKPSSLLARDHLTRLCPSMKALAIIISLSFSWAASFSSSSVCLSGRAGSSLSIALNTSTWTLKDDEWSDLSTEVDSEEKDLELYLSAVEDDATSHQCRWHLHLLLAAYQGQVTADMHGVQQLQLLRCLRTFFLLAIQNEECMRPRCCGMAIPLAIGRQVLTGTEVETSKVKHEEWNAAKRCCCPMPLCSAFLSLRLFPELRGERPMIKCVISNCLLFLCLVVLPIPVSVVILY